MSRNAVVIAAAFTLFVAAPLAAQQNEIGIFASYTTLESTEIEDPEFPDDTASVDFDSDLGYGVSYNRYLSENFSIEFAANQITASTGFTFTNPQIPDQEFDFGELELRTYSAIAQLHLGTGFFSPYFGAGVVHATGSINVNDAFVDPGDSNTVDFESETTWIANAGIDLRFGPSFAIGADVKYFPYEAMEEGGTDESIDLNPLIIAAALKFRF